MVYYINNRCAYTHGGHTRKTGTLRRAQAVPRFSHCARDRGHYGNGVLRLFGAVVHLIRGEKRLWK